MSLLWNSWASSCRPRRNLGAIERRFLTKAVGLSGLVPGVIAAFTCFSNSQAAQKPPPPFALAQLAECSPFRHRLVNGGTYVKHCSTELM